VKATLIECYATASFLHLRFQMDNGTFENFDYPLPPKGGPALQAWASQCKAEALGLLTMKYSPPAAAIVTTINVSTL